MSLELLLILNCQEFIGLCNFMNVPENLHDLWHHNDLFYNLFENVRDFNEDFFFDCDFDRDPFDLFNNSDHSFNMVDVFYNLFHLFENGNLLNYLLHFHDLSVHIDNRNNLLFLNFDLPNLLNDSRHLNHLLDYSLDVLVDSDNLRDDFLNLDYLRNFDKFRHDLLNLINARNCS